MGEPRWLTPPQARAWRGYLRMRALLDLQIARDLSGETALSDADYTVLSVLSEAPDHRMRILDLGEQLLWSSSRLSHQLSRMELRGLVRRDTHPANQRATAAVLTDDGWQAIESAAPAHVESVHRHFLDLLTDDETEVLGAVTDKVVGHLRDFRASQR